MLGLDRMSQRQGLIDFIVCSASVASPYYHLGLLELGQDPLNSAFRDAHRLRDLPNPNVGITGDTEQYVPVIT